MKFVIQRTSGEMSSVTCACQACRQLRQTSQETGSGFWFGNKSNLHETTTTKENPIMLLQTDCEWKSIDVTFGLKKETSLINMAGYILQIDG